MGGGGLGLAEVTPKSGNLLSRGTDWLLELSYTEQVRAWQNMILVREGKVSHQEILLKMVTENGTLQKGMLESLARDLILHVLPKSD